MKKLKVGDIRKAINKLREYQIRPDENGDLRFGIDQYGYWRAFDERDFWLVGKPVGGRGL